MVPVTSYLLALRGISKSLTEKGYRRRLTETESLLQLPVFEVQICFQVSDLYEDVPGYFYHSTYQR